VLVVPAVTAKWMNHFGRDSFPRVFVLQAMLASAFAFAPETGQSGFS
jgi:hypothetical protein